MWDVTKWSCSSLTYVCWQTHEEHRGKSDDYLSGMIQLLPLIHSRTASSISHVYYLPFIIHFHGIHNSCFVEVPLYECSWGSAGGSTLLQSGWCHTLCIMCPRLSGMRRWGQRRRREQHGGDRKMIGLECWVRDECADLAVGQLLYRKRQDILEETEKTRLKE